MELPTVHRWFQVGTGRRTAAIALAWGLVWSGSARAVSGEVIERVLAVVGGELILASDVTAAREFGLVTAAATGDPGREVLSRLIDRALVLTEVERYTPREPAADVIERKLDEARSRFPSSEGFQAALARTGFNERQLRERLRQELRIAAYLDERFTVAAPTEEDVMEFYRDHPERFMSPGQLLPLGDARAGIVQGIVSERRQARVDEWVAGLRRRAQIIDRSLE